MRLFIIKTTLFLIFLSISGLVLLVTFSEGNCVIADKTKINVKNKRIIIGDSHVQLALNDNKLEKTKNLARKGEPLLFSYFKLKKLLENNKSINTVYRGLGYHNISTFNHDVMYGENYKEVLSRYFPLLPVKWKYEILKNNQGKIATLISAIIYYNFKTLIKLESPISAGRANTYFNTSSNPEVIKRRIKLQYYSGNKMRKLSKVNIQYLIKIKELCTQNVINLILINTPLQELYKVSVPLYFKTKYYEIIKENNLKLLDYANMPMSDDSFLPDGDHLSRKGSDLLSFRLKNEETKF